MDTADDELIRWSQLNPRRISDTDRQRFEAYLREICILPAAPRDQICCACCGVSTATPWGAHSSSLDSPMRSRFSRRTSCWRSRWTSIDSLQWFALYSVDLRRHARRKDRIAEARPRDAATPARFYVATVAPVVLLRIFTELTSPT